MYPSIHLRCLDLPLPCPDTSLSKTSQPAYEQPRNGGQSVLADKPFISAALQQMSRLEETEFETVKVWIDLTLTLDVML